MCGKIQHHESVIHRQYQNNQKPGVQMGPQVIQQRPQNQQFKQQQQFSNPPFSASQQAFQQQQQQTLVNIVVI